MSRLKFHVNCVPCFLNQALRVVDTNGRRLSRMDKKGLLNHVMAILKDDRIMEQLPAKTGRDVYALIAEYLGEPDIYKEAKQRSNDEARRLYPVAKAKVMASTDRLRTAATVAIVGNLMDLGTDHHYNLQAEIDSLRLAVDHFDALKAELARARTLLYIADNAGEIFFDKLFLEEITRDFQINVFFSVRAGPIINDATLDDAKAAGIGDLATIIEGTQSPGLLLDEASPELIHAYKAADIIISKGQGNFEALSDRPKTDNLFFLLMAKCQVMEAYFHEPVGSAILAHWKRI
nr:ARMT1-like domain-containing protein [Candidatus Sigynarchaeum springense]